jgi:GTP-binding protein HflX
VVFNKIDLYENGNPENNGQEADEKLKAYHDLKNSWIAKSNNSNIFISAQNRTNIQELRETLYHEVKKIHVQRYPYDDFLY